MDHDEHRALRRRCTEQAMRLLVNSTEDSEQELAILRLAALRASSLIARSHIVDAQGALLRQRVRK